MTTTTHPFVPRWHSVDAHGRPASNYSNARIAIEAKSHIRLSYDTFKCRIRISGLDGTKKLRDVDDEVLSRLRQSILDEFGFDPRIGNIYDVVQQMAFERKFNPVLRFLKRLKWNRKKRLRTWLIEYCGVVDTPLNRAISELIAIAMIMRIVHPGVKFDIMFVLQGEQGCGKSTLVRILAVMKSWFSDQDILRLGGREQQELTQGVWVYEVCELSGWSGADLAKLKAFITRQTDRARKAWGRVRSDQDRCCIFIGTTNEEEFLTDPTGNRRILPVKVAVTHAMKLDELRKVWPQVLAEAYRKVRMGRGCLTLPPEIWAAAAKAQAERLIEDPWLELLREFSAGRSQVTFAEIAQHLGFAPGTRSTALAQRVGACMRLLGFQRKRYKHDGQVVRGYVQHRSK